MVSKATVMRPSGLTLLSSYKNLATKVRKSLTSSLVTFGSSRVSKKVEAAGVAFSGQTSLSVITERSHLSIVKDTYPAMMKLNVIPM